MLRVNSKKYFQYFETNKNKLYIFKSNVISYDIKTIVHFVKCIRYNRKMAKCEAGYIVNP